MNAFQDLLIKAMMGVDIENRILMISNMMKVEVDKKNFTDDNRRVLAHFLHIAAQCVLPEEDMERFQEFKDKHILEAADAMRAATKEAQDIINNKNKNDGKSGS